MDMPNPQVDAATLLANFQAKTEHSEAHFSKLKLEGGRVIGKEFSECVFDHCAFRESTFQACKFNDCTFQDCDLSLVRFDTTSFSDTKFERSTLVGVDWTLASWSRFQADAPISFADCVVDFSAFIGLALRKIVFSKCRFRNTNLSHANFVGATNYSIDLSANKVTKAKFSLPEALALLYNLDIVLVE
jgi:fluoroquinolone resistance protein